MDVIMLVLATLAVFFLSLCRCTEPGILVTSTEADGTVHILIPSASDLPHRESVQPDRVVKRDLTDFRAKFCRETDNCVENFDHFCPWVGNVVGYRNYSYFVVFVSLTIVLDVFVNFVCWYCIATNMDDGSSDAFGDSAKDNIAAIVLIVFTLIIGLSLSPLFVYHCWLVSRNQTTNENIKGVYEQATNPNDLGCFRNCLAFWSNFGTHRPSMVSRGALEMIRPQATVEMSPV